jgi:hypothetical protein
MGREVIFYQTQNKIYMDNNKVKCENIEMLNNELDSWKLMLNKEKFELNNALQNISALEFKLKKIKESEGIKN